MLNAGVSRSAHFLGLNAVWPLNSSSWSSTRGVTKYCSPRPKNSNDPGSAVLTPPTAGSRRASNGVSNVAVTTPKIELPMTGLSPLSLFWLYGSAVPLGVMRTLFSVFSSSFSSANSFSNTSQRSSSTSAIGAGRGAGGTGLPSGGGGSTPTGAAAVGGAGVDGAGVGPAAPLGAVGSEPGSGATITPSGSERG